MIVKPESNDVIAVRNQVLEIDLSNTTITANVDTIATGSSSAGVGQQQVLILVQVLPLVLHQQVQQVQQVQVVVHQVVLVDIKMLDGGMYCKQ